MEKFFVLIVGVKEISSVFFFFFMSKLNFYLSLFIFLSLSHSLILSAAYISTNVSARIYKI